MHYKCTICNEDTFVNWREGEPYDYCHEHGECVYDIDDLSDPRAVYYNIVTGNIAKLSDEQIKELYPHLFEKEL